MKFIFNVLATAALLASMLVIIPVALCYLTFQFVSSKLGDEVEVPDELCR